MTGKYILTTDMTDATEDTATTEIFENFTTWKNVTDNPPNLPPNFGGIPAGHVELQFWLVPLVLGLVSLTGIIGNSVVIFLVFKNGKMHTVTNFYIVNLAVTDIAFLAIVVPFAASQYVSRFGVWYFGRTMCKLVNYLQLTAAQAACITLTMMSVDRYQAIVFPLRSLRTRTTKVAAIVSGCIWTYSILVSIPLLVYFDLKILGPFKLCLEHWPPHLYKIMYRGYAVYLFIVIYAMPVMIISFCYAHMLLRLWTQDVPAAATSEEAQERQSRQKRKITYMVLTVVIVFAVCWFPFHLVNLWVRVGTTYPFKTKAGKTLQIFVRVLAYSNSCLNPFVYAFMGENFRKYFRRTCSCCYSSKVAPEPSSVEGRSDVQERTVGGTLHTNVPQ